MTGRWRWPIIISGLVALTILGMVAAVLVHNYQLTRPPPSDAQIISCHVLDSLERWGDHRVSTEYLFATYEEAHKAGLVALEANRRDTDALRVVQATDRLRKRSDGGDPIGVLRSVCG